MLEQIMKISTDMVTIINQLKDRVSADVHQPSSIIYRRNLNNTSSVPLDVKSTDETKHSTFVKSADGKSELRTASTAPFAPITDMGDDNGGTIYFRSKGISSFPVIAELEIYPYYNLTGVTLNNLDDLSEYMIHLKDLTLNSYDNGSLIEPSCSGDVANLAKIPTLENILFNTAYLLNPEAVYGDIGALGDLVNLATFNCGSAMVYGDLANTLDKMHENGRISGELQFRCRSTKVVLTYNGDTIRVGPSTATHQSGNVYGWRIVFDSTGWTVAETYTNPA